jgi:gluconolactonase
MWVFTKLGAPIFRIKSCAGMRPTSVAFGGQDNMALFITEAEHGVILAAQLPVRGRMLYSHM